MYSAPTLVDLNRDGKMEIVVGTSMVGLLCCAVLCCAVLCQLCCAEMYSATLSALPCSALCLFISFSLTDRLVRS